MSAEDCMPNGLVDEAGLTGCASQYHLLASLAALNIWSALLHSFFGHDRIRAKLNFFSKGIYWHPWKSFLTCALHPIAMIVSAITMRVNGFDPNLFLVFAVWTMRPRMVSAPIWYILNGGWARSTSNPYLWTFKDAIMEETLLNIFSLPFALFFVIVREDSLQGDCADDHDYQQFWDSFYLVLVAGVLSLLVFAILIVSGIRRFLKREKRVPGKEITPFWKWLLWLGGLNMLLAFAAQWLLWGTFIHNAGLDFCPGSIVGESAAWALALFFVAIGRPIIGGPDS